MATVSEAVSIALDHHIAGRVAEAETLYTRVLEAAPGHPDASHLLGLLLAQTGRVPEGLVHIDAAVAANPDAPVFRLNQGKLREAMGRIEEAVQSYLASLSRQPDNADAAERLAATLRVLAERAYDADAFLPAMALYRRVLALNPTDLNAAFDVAMAVTNAGRMDKAAIMAGHAARLAPDLQRAQLLEAEALRALGRMPEAAEAYRRAANADPDSPPVWMTLALTLQSLGVSAKAAAAYRSLLALEPANGGAWNNLCVALRGLGRAADAVAAGRRAARLAPQDADALVNLGAAQLAAEKPRDAAETGRRALALDPASADLLLNLGSALDGQHAVDAAERALRRALRLRPGEGPVLAQLGRVLERAGRPDEAAPVLRRALAALPADEEGWAALGRAALRRGNPIAARSCAGRALNLRPNLPTGLLLSGAVSEALAAEADALAAYDRVIALAPGIGTAFSRRAILLLRRVTGEPPKPRAASGRARLAGTQIGNAGRFGNQLLQYGFLRILADRHGLELEVPDWIGRPLYGLDDPLPGTPLPFLHEEEIGRAGTPAGHDIVGFFCGDTSPYAPDRERFRSLFQPVAPVAARADAALSRLRERGRTLVAIHLRRGDFGTERFWIAPEDWYLSWLAALWPTLDRPVLYLATDAPDLARRFAAYQPLTAQDVAEPLPGAEFFADHWILSKADVLAVSNSSFSVTAAMLNPGASILMRPDRRAGGLVPFDPWAGPVLLD